MSQGRIHPVEPAWLLACAFHPRRAEATLLAGIDIGGTKTAFALADDTGGGTAAAIAARARRPTQPSGDAETDLRRMAEDLRQLLAKHGSSPRDLAVVGVSVAGPLDVDLGVVLRPPNLPHWDRAPVRELLEAELGCPVQLDNDANAAALAEWHYGAGQGTQHMVYLTMSTGVGGGLILGGRIHRGVACSAGEVGHIPIEWEGDLCHCGMRGCLEAYIGGAAWAERLAQITPASSRVALLAGPDGSPRPEHVVLAAREGDAFALSEMARFNDYLARGIVHLAFTLAPECVVLGTIVTAAGEDLCLGPVREQVRARTWPAVGDPLRIEASALGEDLPYLAGLAVAHEMRRQS
ncbi:MAG: ROK family protein [Deltaproteobacteria bacterium]|nr:ROK family protein [Deltaproteobacteria bacterium]MBW2362522.1 ROK family protein [Deltaproteobacteria bacterium]